MARASLQSAFEAIEVISAATSLDELTDALTPYLKRMGLSAFSAGVARLGNATAPNHVTTWPDAWRAHWSENGYWTVDPTVAFSIKNHRLFTWSEVTALATIAGRRVMDEATAFGLRGGITQPVHGLSGLAGNVSAGGEAIAWSPDELAAFQLVATYFHGKFCALAGLNTPLASPVLTSRERECLCWVAAGKTAWDISVILGIGEYTVREHIKTAARKLDCVTQTQAVCEAIRRGEIAI